jgi:hypothetical protein
MKATNFGSFKAIPLFGLTKLWVVILGAGFILMIYCLNKPNVASCMTCEVCRNGFHCGSSRNSRENNEYDKHVVLCSRAFHVSLKSSSSFELSEG